MDIKFLISIKNRPWLVEPGAAQYWADLAGSFFKTGNLPVIEKRVGMDIQTYGDSAIFRVNPLGAIDSSGPIQIFRMNAPVAKYDYCGSPGSQTWTQYVNAAKADPSVKAVLIWMDTPGGQADGTEELATAIKETAAVKPVISFGDGMICSGGYWIASGSTEIIVTDSNGGWNATIGSIGTMCAWLDDSEKMAKEGIKLITVFADDSSDKWGTYFQTQSGDYTRLKQELNGMNKSFIGAVTLNRQGKIDLDKENVLSGKTYNANEAIKYGLADRKGSLQDAIKRALFLSNKSIKQQSMSSTAVAFGAVLIAAKASAFDVVEGGFLLTEEQLNNVNSKLDKDDVTASATASQLKILQTQAESFAGADKTAKDLLDAQAKITALETKLQAAEGIIAKYGNIAGSKFITTTSEGDAPVDEPDYQSIINNLPHNKKADALVPVKKN